VVNRSLINIIQPFIGKLGSHYPSRIEMQGYIYNLNFNNSNCLPNITARKFFNVMPPLETRCF